MNNLRNIRHVTPCIRNIKFMSTTRRLTHDDVEEVKIPVPWGHIAGKWWGPKWMQPIVCVHGWQDNAASFDCLLPELSGPHSYLSIDLPGHGLSSKLPHGAMYLNYDSVATLRRIHKHFNWKKISFLCHSLGSINAYLYSCLYPDDVDFYIGIDAMKPRSVDLKKKHGRAALMIDLNLKNDDLKEENAPSYTREELINRWIKDTGSSMTRESCEVLMTRGVVQVSEGRVRPARDPKVKTDALYGFNHQENLKLATHIQCSVLIIKSKLNSYYDKPEDFYDVLDVVKASARYFEYHKVEGTHHLHMNTPQLIAPLIDNFISKVEMTPNQ